MKTLPGNWISHLNARFEGEVKIFRLASREPEIEVESFYPLTESQKAKAGKHRAGLGTSRRPNDLHAIVANAPHWQDHPFRLHIQLLDFAAVCALREEGLKPPVLSSSAVIVCRESREILLHKRAGNVATHPGCLHTFGGAYLPAETDGSRGDGSGLRHTLAREVQEETQLILPAEASPPMMIAQELDTSFIQFVFLGFGTSPEALRRLEDNWEGRTVRVPFSRLQAVLQRPDWVPSGKAHVLAWLALGAPNAGSDPEFGGLSPAQLFDMHAGS